MKKIKKFLLAGLTLLATASLAACASHSSDNYTDSDTNYNAKSYTPSVVQLQFTPTQNATKIENEAKPLEKMLTERVGVPVHITTAGSLSGTVSNMSAKKIDAAFMPAGDYVVAHNRGVGDAVLQSVRYGVTSNGQQTKKLTREYRGEILVKKGSKIRSWKDLKGKSISVQDSTSSSGYIYPIAELKQKGLNVTRKCKLVSVVGHDQAVLNVLNGKTDAAFVYQDARSLLKNEKPNIRKEVVPIYVTKLIPNDTFVVRSNMSKAFRNKLAKAVISVEKTKKGHKILEEIYGHEGYVRAKDSDFDVIRQNRKIAVGNKNTRSDFYSNSNSDSDSN